MPAGEAYLATESANELGLIWVSPLRSMAASSSARPCLEMPIPRSSMPPWEAAVEVNPMSPAF